MKSVVLVFFSSCVASMCVAGPRISSPAQTYDFGTTNYGAKVVHVFTFTNSGDEILNIKNIRACCGASAMVSAGNLKPGETATAEITLLSSAKTGDITKAIHLVTNDPANPYFMLTIKGSINSNISTNATAVARSSNPVVQTTCPFKDEPIQKQYFHDHKGKRIYTCCPECLEVVKVKPELAIRRLAEKRQFPVEVKSR